MNKKLAALAATFALLLTTSVVMANPTYLVGRWHLNVDGKDSSGNGNDATVDGATLAMGKFGRALEFDGVDDYAYVSSGGMDKTEGTFELWVKPLDLSKTPQAFMVVDTAGNPHNYQIQYWTNGKLYFRANHSGQEVSVLASSVGFTQNEWHHLAMTWSSEGVGAYLDGELLDFHTGFIATYDLSDHLYIGSWWDEDRNAKAIIDEVRVWNCALTAEEIGQHATSNSSAAPSCQDN